MVAGLFTILNVLAIASSLPMPVKNDDRSCISMTPQKQQLFKYLETKISDFLLKLETEIRDIIITDVTVSVEKYTEEAADKDINFNVSVNTCAEDVNTPVDTVYLEELEEPSANEQPNSSETKQKSNVTQESVDKTPEVIEGPNAWETPKDEEVTVNEIPDVIQEPTVNETPAIIEDPNVTMEPKGQEPSVDEILEDKEPTVNEGPRVSQDQDSKGAKDSQEAKPTDGSDYTKELITNENPEVSQVSNVATIIDNNSQENQITEESTHGEQSEVTEVSNAGAESSAGNNNISEEVIYSDEYLPYFNDGNEEEWFQDYEDSTADESKSNENYINDTNSYFGDSNESGETEQSKSSDDNPEAVTTFDDDTSYGGKSDEQVTESKPDMEVVVINLNEEEEDLVKNRENEPFLLIEHGGSEREIKFF